MRQYETYIDLQHVTQLSRALTNIEIGANYIKPEKIYPVKGKYAMQFERTKSIARGKDKRGVTGCPEALWQFHLYNGSTYLGRIGINFHNEGVERIVTIANIQGAEGRAEQLEAFKKATGKRFNDALVEKLKEILGPRFHYRGIVNPEKNPAMYQMTFRRAKMPTYSLKTGPASA
ncbi:MAG: hypothetical protein IPJ89_00550 [Candidatus Iainarchaeum archaeon]|uniref:Uncharacterized protein n=1 Tax=Candidatus Iainarchaeum sp. TaxID=3101447 RepID=A0A7T9I1S4_9ARCH|nr:MAG: hypothetical protein IPJ89_00550 [Candidatus Diapherotrites archaeon]